MTHALFWLDVTLADVRRKDELSVLVNGKERTDFKLLLDDLNRAPVIYFGDLTDYERTHVQIFRAIVDAKDRGFKFVTSPHDEEMDRRRRDEEAKIVDKVAVSYRADDSTPEVPVNEIAFNVRTRAGTEIEFDLTLEQWARLKWRIDSFIGERVSGEAITLYV